MNSPNGYVIKTLFSMLNHCYLYNISIHQGFIYAK